MFVKLEDERTVVLAPEESPEAECYCQCGTSTSETEEPGPAVDKTGTALAVYFDING